MTRFSYADLVKPSKRPHRPHLFPATFAMVGCSVLTGDGKITPLNDAFMIGGRSFCGAIEHLPMQMPDEDATPDDERLCRRCLSTKRGIRWTARKAAVAA